MLLKVFKQTYVRGAYASYYLNTITCTNLFCSTINTSQVEKYLFAYGKKHCFNFEVILCDEEMRS